MRSSELDSDSESIDGEDVERSEVPRAVNIDAFEGAEWSQGTRILIVDDEPYNLMGLKIIL